VSLDVRSQQVDRDWLAVQYATTRSELWHDGGVASLQRPAARLPDGAVLIGADPTGRRVVVWEPNGAVLLLAGDVLLLLGHHPPVTRDAVLLAACALIKSRPPDRSALARFAFGEPLHACGR
jgi:hypothetical protein